jgi:hypothetical protein
MELKITAPRIYPFGNLRKILFSLSDDEASFARRGFHESQACKRLEHIGVTFLFGYNTALEETLPANLVSRLNAVAPEMRGFAFEGAAMGLALLDLITPWKKNRWLSFIQNGAEAHLYMVHVGAGWALARLGRWARRHPSLLDPLYRWLSIGDGYGFHEGYFYNRRFVQERVRPSRFSGYALKAFDQGLGRSIWFVDGADVERIPATISSFPPSRQADLWAGVGLACAYAGGATRSGIEFLQKAAATYAPHLAQGAAFAAKARQKAANPAAHTQLACEVLCGTSAEDAAEVTDIALKDLPADRELPSYEIWRQRIREQFAWH